MKPIRLFSNFIPALLVTLFIFSLSLQPGDASTQNTATLSQSLANSLGIGVGDSTASIDDPNAQGVGGTTIWKINLLIRSLARVIAFGGLGLMIVLGCALSRFRTKTYIYLTLGVGTLISFIDECIKLFVPGRHFSVLDIGKNAVGLVLALIGSYILYLLYQWYTSRRTANTSHIHKA